MKGREFVGVGDIVLITTREFSSKDIEVEGKGKKVRMGDIIAKYPFDQLSSLKKEPGVNPRIFMKLETVDGCNLKDIGDDLTKTEIVGAEEDDYVFESSDEEYDAEDKERREKERKKRQNEVVSEESISVVVKPEAEKQLTLDDL
jgi:hypothetical protein